jgi:hypothetical protein
MKLNFQQIYFWRKRERLHLFSFAHEEIEKDHTYLFSFRHEDTGI